MDEKLRTADSLEALARLLGGNVEAKAVFGEPVRQGDVTVVPVAKAAWGLGRGGSRDGRTPGPNMGGGVTIRPVGYLELRNDHSAFHSIRQSPSGALVAAAAAGLVAGLLLGWRLR